MCVFAGVAEQFAIAEAKLRAWSSVDGDESNDDSYDEDFLPANEPTTQSTGKHTHTFIFFILSPSSLICYYTQSFSSISLSPLPLSLSVSFIVPVP